MNQIPAIYYTHETEGRVCLDGHHTGGHCAIHQPTHPHAPAAENFACARACGGMRFSQVRRRAGGVKLTCITSRWLFLLGGTLGWVSLSSPGTYFTPRWNKKEERVGCGAAAADWSLRMQDFWALLVLLRRSSSQHPINQVWSHARPRSTDNHHPPTWTTPLAQVSDFDACNCMHGIVLSVVHRLCACRQPSAEGRKWI